MSDSDASVTPTSDFMADSPNGRREQESRRVTKQLAFQAKQRARDQQQARDQENTKRSREYEALVQVGFPKSAAPTIAPKIEIDLTDQQSGVVWEPIGKCKCKYGAKCYQTSPIHKQNFSHPKHEELTETMSQEAQHEEMTETMSQEAQRLPLTETKEDRDAIAADDATLSVEEGSEEESEYSEEETSEGDNVQAKSPLPGDESGSSEWDIETLSKEFKAESLHGELAKLCAAIKQARQVLVKENKAQLVVREETRQMQMQAHEKMLAMWKKLDADMQACSRQARECICATKKLYTTTTTTTTTTTMESTSKKTSKKTSKESKASKETSKTTTSKTRKLTQQTLTQQNEEVFGPFGKRERDAKASSSDDDSTWALGKMAGKKKKH